MKIAISELVLLLAFAISAPAQSIRKLEKKAKKTFKKEAHGMALYYSQAILKLDSGHTNALHWANIASEALHLSDRPSDLFTKVPDFYSPMALPENLPEIKNNVPATVALVVNTYNALDSSALNGTYIGLTNDGFGQGLFMQNDEMENRAVFQIPVGEFFTITGTKNRFSSGTPTLSTTEMGQTDTLFCELYLSPSWGLPIALYFDYGKPNALHPSDSMTNLTYEDAWLDYLYRIDEYIDSNTISDSMADKAKAQTEVGLFFANHIDANFQKLKPLCELLAGYLKTGKTITLAIEGHTPAMEQDQYANALLSRRLHSVENYFSFYENGLLKPWLTNGDLKIERQYLVEKQTGEITSKSSAYDLSAAKMRKVVVRMVVGQ